MSESDYLQSQDDLYYWDVIRPQEKYLEGLSDQELAQQILSDIKAYRRYRINVEEVCKSILRKGKATERQRGTLMAMYAKQNF